MSNWKFARIIIIILSMIIVTVIKICEEEIYSQKFACLV